MLLYAIVFLVFAGGLVALSTAETNTARQTQEGLQRALRREQDLVQTYDTELQRTYREVDSLQEEVDRLQEEVERLQEELAT